MMDAKAMPADYPAI